jgi:hypothetical protein
MVYYYLTHSYCELNYNLTVTVLVFDGVAGGINAHLIAKKT